MKTQRFGAVSFLTPSFRHTRSQYIDSGVRFISYLAALVLTSLAYIPLLLQKQHHFLCSFRGSQS